MGVFKKTAAVQIEKMAVLKDVIITEEDVKMSFNYSNITFKIEDIPKLLSDVMQLYVYVKPVLDKKEVKELRKKAGDTEDDTPLDLSEIPF